MCGICGILNFDSRAPVERSLLQPMCDVVTHRGPDEEGFYTDGEFGMGIRRLRIIDLATGQQPIHNEDKTVWVVLNGEVYNYRDITKQLKAKGHQFYTQSDAEPIVHLYEDRGDACVEQLRGMFAFSLWDTRRRRLILARDRVGEKQLYYTIDNQRLAFGSEIKCLLAEAGQKRAIDLNAVRDFFAFLYVAGERTIFQGIKRLPPAHILVCEDGHQSLKRYWNLEPRNGDRNNEGELVEEFRERYTDAVKSMLVSDVPLGAFLSGGIDSSSVVGVMSRLSATPVKTFTVGYDAEGMTYDERPYARLIADKFATEHHELIVKPQVEEIIPKIVRSFDEPFGDSSAIPNYYISKFTREHVTVALSGLGGDEVGGGYERYMGMLLAERFKKIPKFIRQGIITNLINRLPDSRNGALAIDRAKRFVSAVDYGFDERYLHYLSTFTPGELERLFTPALKKRLTGPEPGYDFSEIISRFKDHDPLDQLIYSDFCTYLPDDLLVLTDRLSMAHSLEVRSPFLDHRLLEFVATIPSTLKIRGWTKKYLLKKAFAPILPREILKRKKIGFSVPLAVWLRGSLRPFLLDRLTGKRIKELGFFNEQFVSTLVDEHLAYRHNHENKLWALLIFSVWHELYMEGRA